MIGEITLEKQEFSQKGNGQRVLPICNHDGFISANIAQLGLNPLLAAYISDILVSWKRIGRMSTNVVVLSIFDKYSEKQGTAHHGLLFSL